MNVALAFTRIFFTILSIFFITLYMIQSNTGELQYRILFGLVGGFSFSLLLIGFDTFFRKFNLRSFNIAIIGLFIGYLMGEALVLILKAILSISALSFSLNITSIEIITICLFLFGTYLGTIMTLRWSDELYVSIPFIKFSQMNQRRRDLMIDMSTLLDPRFNDLCTTRILDQSILIPRFIVKELYALVEEQDENIKGRARKAIETLKRLETLPGFGLRYNETDFPEIKEIAHKIVRLSRLVDANILTAESKQYQLSGAEGVEIINLNILAAALKPIMQSGEFIHIKVQRQGKEPQQGVGYLEDGTMVVINNAGDAIGQTIRATILSSKSSPSGRIIFCNAVDKSGREIAYESFDEYHDEDA
ncbi:MAG: hypothetical protein ACOYK9_02485 [Chlamydiia bacterium]